MINYMQNENPFELDQLKKWSLNVHSDLWATTNFMESQEDWLFDKPGDSFLLTCVKLAKYFNSEIKESGIFIESNKEKISFIYGLAYLGTCKSLRLLNLVGQKQPGLGGDLIQLCINELNNNGPHKAECNIVLMRIKQVIKMDCYKRVFGPDRRKTVLNFFNQIKEENI